MAGRKKLDIFLTKKISLTLGGPKKALVLKCDFSPDDFDLSWVEFFENQKEHPNLFKKLIVKKDEFTIMDRRTDSKKKIWKLDSTIKRFIGSFKRKLKSYRAAIGHRPINKVFQVGSNEWRQGRPSIAASARSHSFRPSLSSIGVPCGSMRGQCPISIRSRNSLDRQTRRAKPVRAVVDKRSGNRVGGVPKISQDGGLGEREAREDDPPPNPLHSPVQVDMDEVVSIADSDHSEDSQVEQLNNRNIQSKADFLRCINERLDYPDICLIKEELRNLYRNGQLNRIARDIPQTMNILNFLIYDPPQ